MALNLKNKLKFPTADELNGNYELFSNGSKVGAFPKEEIIELVNNGTLGLDAMVKLNGVWTTLDKTNWDFNYSRDPVDFGTGINSDDANDLPPEQNEDEGRLVECPHCWYRFSLTKVNFISKHPELIGDPILGSEAQLRFLPTSFNAQGYAVDAKGMVCQDMACPNCHQKIPEAIIDLPSTMISIAGAPASGKSYYLAAMTWQLRNVLSKQLDYSFVDTDATFNSVLNNYESILFLNRNNNDYVALPKTELQGNDFSHQIMLNGIGVDLPLPFIFTLSPTGFNQNYTASEKVGRNIILYDNAGEHFEPGRDSVTNLATQHLIHSNGICFLFDPIKDSRMVTQCNPADPQVAQISKGTNQLILLNEMIARIRKYTGLKNNEKYNKPLVVIIPKYDAWRDIFPFDLEKTPFLYYDEANFTYNLEIGQITNISFVTREMLLEIAPEVVVTSESFFEQVYFLPVSSLGRMPEYDRQRDMIGIRPVNLNPIWAEVPMLLQLWLTGNISAVSGEFPGSVPIEKYKFIGSSMVYSLPGMQTKENIPSNYWGRSVYSKKLNKYIKFPMPEQPAAEAVKSVEEDDFWNK